jgi:23S rRNA (uracil1939-C5)-methyltransferase
MRLSACFNTSSTSASSNLAREKTRSATTFSPDNALQMQAWGYRRKARLGVCWVAKKNKVLVGFREKKSGWIANMDRCEVLHTTISEHLQDLGGVY